ncbi:MAG: hypothetical protein KUG64_10705, partial [Cycloclasticus sp.]|nr:hypothetical protein [Cycloclasticus sp.]
SSAASDVYKRQLLKRNKMQILVTKSVYHISANENKIDCPIERKLVDDATKMMGDIVGEKCFNGCDDEYEYYNTLGSNDYTINEIKEFFRNVKKELK